ncbi:MAG: elongation factor 1-beta [Candidatus Thermoplasmatota archaeon]
MGEVAVTFRIMPDDASVDLAHLKDEVVKRADSLGRLVGVEEQPIAFGLKALMLRIVIEDAEGALDRIEKRISEIPEVQSIEAVEMGRLL